MAKRGGSSGKSGGSKFQEVTDDKIFDTSVEKWRNDITREEDNSVFEYTGDAYIGINEGLRTGEGFSEDYYEFMVNDIDSAIGKFNLKQNIVVYRGVSKAAFGGAGPEVGAILQDKGFMSTTVKKSVAASFDKGYILKINVPKGKGRGAYVRSISQFSNEHEFLMKRSSKLKITRVGSGESEGFHGGQTVIYADLV